MTKPLVLYPFRFRDVVTGKWSKARYVATREDIEARYAEWEIVGQPEIREAGRTGYFSPYRLISNAELKRLEEPRAQLNPHLEQPPAIDDVERFLVSLFLRRYMAYCARRRRMAEMQGAARLWREVAAPQGGPCMRLSSP
jgi:hypothetical protein